MLTIDPATIRIAFFLYQERATDKDLAARAATRALALTAGKKLIVPGSVNVCTEEPPKFSCNLAGAK
jgi:hypothetical protein